VAFVARLKTANAADASVLKPGDDNFFGLANGTEALDSPDTPNTIKLGVCRERAEGSDREETRGQRVAREGIHEIPISSDSARDLVDHCRVLEHGVG
jgi:hypothetical protein